MLQSYIQDACKYGAKEEAVKYCYDCGNGLCSGCGYTCLDGKTRCNECYENHTDSHCPECLGEMMACDYQNNGFNDCPIVEATAEVCLECGYKKLY